MILVDEEIKEAVSNGEVKIIGFSDKCLQPASYDLRVGEEAFTSSSGQIINTKSDGFLEIQPGDFALVMTHEKLSIPSHMLGRFGLRSVFARMGLLSTAGPQVDPGFIGKLVIGLVNFSSQSIKLSYLEPFCTLELHRLTRQVKNPYIGPYQGQEHLTDKIISEIPKEPFPLAVMLIRQLAAVSPSLGLKDRTRQPRREVSKSIIAFEQEKLAFEQLKGELLKTHKDEYVVIKDRKPVMFGHDKTELAKHAYKKFGYGPLYVGLLRDEPEAIHIPTPRIPRSVS